MLHRNGTGSGSPQLVPRQNEPETAVDLTNLHAITARLEASKAAGWLSEYLVAWHGRGGQLLPSVTVWRAAGVSEKAVESYVSRLLVGLVAAGNIFVTRS